MQKKVGTFTEILESIHGATTVDEFVSAVLQKLLFCPFCDEHFTSSSALMDHIREDHSDRLVSNAKRVETHEVDEDAETIYICPHCHFAVDNNCLSPISSIISHIENHIRSLDPTTRISFHISNDKKLIQTYIKGTVEIELFYCSICKDMFSVSETLLRHLSLKHSTADSKNIPNRTISLIKDYAKNFLERNKTKIKRKLKYPY